MNPVIRSEGSTYWLDNFFAAPTFCHGPFEEKNRSSFEKLSRTDTSTQKTQSASKLSLFPNDSTGVMKDE